MPKLTILGLGQANASAGITVEGNGFYERVPHALHFQGEPGGNNVCGPLTRATRASTAPMRMVTAPSVWSRGDQGVPSSLDPSLDIEATAQRAATATTGSSTPIAATA